MRNEFDEKSNEKIGERRWWSIFAVSIILLAFAAFICMLHMP